MSYYQSFPKDKLVRGKVYDLVRKLGVWVRLRFVWTEKSVPLLKTPVSRPAGQVVSPFTERAGRLT